MPEPSETMIKTTKMTSARPPAWATHTRNRPADRTSPALPEDVISRIATLLLHDIARPDDAGELVRAAEEVRAMRGRLEGLEMRVGELEAEKAAVDGREAERLIVAYANEFGG